jgi:hypothetical protein
MRRRSREEEIKKKRKGEEGIGRQTKLLFQ